MSALSITAANVVPGTDADIAHGIAGETITAGQPVYRSSTDGKWYKADSNSGTAEARVPLGIALCGSSASQPVSVQKSGTITIGATVTAGTVYYLGDTAGGIIPVADLTTGDYPCTIGIAVSAAALKLGFNSAGVAL